MDRFENSLMLASQNCARISAHDYRSDYCQRSLNCRFRLRTLAPSLMKSAKSKSRRRQRSLRQESLAVVNCLWRPHTAIRTRMLTILPCPKPRLSRFRLATSGCALNLFSNCPLSRMSTTSENQGRFHLRASCRNQSFSKVR
jgi:hypothetical protein